MHIYSYCPFLRSWVCFIFIFFLVFNIIAQNTKKTLYLSGTDNNHTVSWDFFCTDGRKSSKWDKIEVPSCWEQQGYGSYNYGRDYYTYGRSYKYASEQGLYKYQFTVPADWKKKEVFIVFEGSMTDTEVKINGQLAGAIHRGAFYRFSYNISNLIKYGEKNLLEVTVSKMSEEKSVNEAERTADYWIFGGIFRPVYLEVVPRAHISRVAINAQANGDFEMQVFPQNILASCDIVADIVDSYGKKVASFNKKLLSTDSLVIVKGKISNPANWSSETPNLYKVKYCLKKSDKIIFEAEEKFGFRTIEVRRGDGIYINGTKVKLKGINRHVWWPESGRTVNRDIDLMDVMLIKQMNMNAVRCAHYPPDVAFLDLCDSLGLYVIDELAGWQDAYSTEAGRPLIREMVTRDVNHPSIIFWSNGNEGGSNKALDADYAWYDPSNRPVIRAHHRPGNAINGIDCNHYENYYSTQKILSDTLIYMPTEFLHCQDDGGGGAGLQDFWELMWRSPRSGGGFLWAFADEGLARTDLNNTIDVNGVNAEDGVLGPHREKEGSFWAIREIFSPVIIQFQGFDNNGIAFLKVNNRFHFTNLDKCSFKWELARFRLPYDRQSGSVKIAEEGFNVSAAPLDSTTVALKLPSEFDNADVLNVSAIDPLGNKIMNWSFRTKDNQKLISSFLNPLIVDSVQVSENDTCISLKANKISISIRKRDGRLCNINTAAKVHPHFYNGPAWVNGETMLSGFKHFRDTDAYVVEATYSSNYHYTRWKMYGNGWVALEYSYKLVDSVEYSGVSFDYPENYMLNAKWLGNGPYRVWKNRMEGGSINVWENAYNNTQTGYTPWIYPEFKGYFSDITWMEFNTAQGKFYMVTPEQGLYVRLFDFYATPGPDAYPKLPKGDISFLEHIPAAGTKMSFNMSPDASINGPQGKKNAVNGIINRTLYFYFGAY